MQIKLARTQIDRDKMKKSYSIQWFQYKKDLHELAEKLSTHKFSGIYGIPRGGLVIAVNLSHILKLPLLASPRPHKRGEKPLLIVDDVSDTGKTLRILASRLKERRIDFQVATLYRKDGTIYEPNYFTRTINQWIQFSWES